MNRHFALQSTAAGVKWSRAFSRLMTVLQTHFSFPFHLSTSHHTARPTRRDAVNARQVPSIRSNAKSYTCLPHRNDSPLPHVVGVVIASRALPCRSAFARTVEHLCWTKRLFGGEIRACEKVHALAAWFVEFDPVSFNQILDRVSN